MGSQHRVSYPDRERLQNTMCKKLCPSKKCEMDRIIVLALVVTMLVLMSGMVSATDSDNDTDRPPHHQLAVDHFKNTKEMWNLFLMYIFDKINAILGFLFPPSMSPNPM